MPALHAAYGRLKTAGRQISRVAINWYAKRNQGESSAGAVKTAMAVAKMPKTTVTTYNADIE